MLIRLSVVSQNLATKSAKLKHPLLSQRKRILIALFPSITKIVVIKQITILLLFLILCVNTPLSTHFKSKSKYDSTFLKIMMIIFTSFSKNEKISIHTARFVNITNKYVNSVPSLLEDIAKDRQTANSKYPYAGF